MDDFNISVNLHSTFMHQRTVIHIDVDCFYAQVEMLKNPVLKQQPLGIQQKNIVVTCNYVARDYGVEKCMLVTDAMKLCPKLVLVSGEDLYDYRQMSTKITKVLQTFSPLVEKLGLDENFIDVTQLVDERRRNIGTSETVNLEGHSYDTNSSKDCSCGCRSNLLIGSQIASEMRRKIFSELDITTCAGVSYNKLLAKLVGSTHKPNQQTTLFPSGVLPLLSSLKSLRNIPGIGHCMHDLLKSISVVTISDLQNATLEALQQSIGQETALRIKKLSFGIDDSIVKQSGKPQTIGLEDGFQKIGLVTEVKEKFTVLMKRLMKLLAEDGRMPGSVKITVRKYDSIAKHSHRESRQCNISPSLFSPGCIGQLKGTGNQKLISSIMQLFHKIVDVRKTFHLTLLGVAFTKFHERSTGKSSIASFLQKDLSVQSVTDLRNTTVLEIDTSPTSLCAIRNSSSRFSTDKSGSESEVEPSPKKTRTNIWVNTRKRLASEMDQDSPSKLRVSEMRLSSPRQSIEQGNCSRDVECSAQTVVRVSQLQCPDNVDETVFRELPVDVQNELIVEWKRMKGVCSKAKAMPVSNDSKQSTIMKYFILNKNLG